jgi:two-component system sensor histidine kinase KdpD
MPPVLFGQRIEPVQPATITLSEYDREALDLCWSDKKPTGICSEFASKSSWRFEPMVSGAGEIGVIGVHPKNQSQIDEWFSRLLAAIAEQTATVLDRIAVEHTVSETRICEEREKLRAMLLSSVSHDFKTPLAGIIGALTVHRSLGDKLTPEKRMELIEAAIEEAQRLDSFVTNILDMTRLESGNIKFRQEWNSLNDMLDGVIKRLKYRLRHHRLVIHPFTQDLEVYADLVMTQQVLVNILDNAGKYTPSGTLIEVRCEANGGKGGKNQGLLFEVRDHGNGFPTDKIDCVFDKYTRLQKKDMQIAGTGLGLAVSKAVMEKQGGWITAKNHPEGGVIIAFWLPSSRLAVANSSA